MLFVAPEGYASSVLRGQQVARALGVPCIGRMDGTRDDVVVFVKSPEAADIERAHRQGNVVVYDPLDFFCYPRREAIGGVDVVLAPSMVAAGIYARFFPGSMGKLVPHHWDARLSGACELDRPRAGYIGAAFNAPDLAIAVDGVDLECVTDPQRMLGAARRFNIHVCVSRREGLGALLKPATKIAVAAAVGAVAVTYPDPSAVELLGARYPFYVHESLAQTLAEAISGFGGEAFMEARRIMAGVRERTSLESIAKLYEEIECPNSCITIH